MIKLELTGPCKDCHDIDLFCNYFAYDDTGLKAYTVRCIHDNVCGKLAGEEAAHDLPDQDRDEAAEP